LVYFVIDTGFTGVFADMVDLNNSDVSNRLIVQMEALGMFLNNPIYGIGWGQFIMYTRTPMFVTDAANLVATPHNGIVQLLAETGIVGTFLSLFLSITLIKQIRLSIKNMNNNFEQLFAKFILWLLVFVFVQQFFQTSTLFPPPTQRDSVRIPFYYWFLSGFAISLGRNKLHKGVNFNERNKVKT